ncbi:hypothetical protein [Prescottella equi]|uniref:hypothetical protein n=1 Tax=Rhodococcus hoagii TaxID=43767 RepID=UPI001EEB1F11|nr:hypothetical protein [Prescottella equi]
MSQDLARARRGIHIGAGTHAEQAETALAATVHENNELRAQNERMTATISRAQAVIDECDDLEDGSAYNLWSDVRAALGDDH